LRLIIEADGGSRGNPGNAGSGAVVIDAASGKELAAVAKHIGIATNNVAEYEALIAGLEAALDIDPSCSLIVRMDSKLVIEQMAGRWKIKHPDMLTLGARVQELVAGLSVSWVWIPREENSRADALANQAMDLMSDSRRSSSAVAEHDTKTPSSVRAPEVVEKKATTIILVRHGRTSLTEDRRISGMLGEDPDLSELGLADAKRAAFAIERIGSSGPWSYLERPAAVIHSPLKRSAQTAKKIAQAIGAPLFAMDEFQEISFGKFDGLTNEEVIANFPKEYEAWRGSYDVPPPAGESLSDFDYRIFQGAQRLLEKYKGQTVVLVAHVMPIRGLLKRALDAGPASYWRSQIAPASISIIRFWGHEAAEVIAVNATDHLA
jgi:broad specificity phosphatase PhoE/ribonuclease HI